MFADILTAAASWQSEHPLLTYIVPTELQDELRPGQLVAIPYGDRLVEGIVWHVYPSDIPSESVGTRFIGSHGVGTLGGVAENLRSILTILDLEPVLLPHQRQLAEWIADYYVTPL